MYLETSQSCYLCQNTNKEVVRGSCDGLSDIASLNANSPPICTLVL